MKVRCYVIQAVWLFLLCAGCTHSYNTQRENISSLPKLAPQASAYVALPENGHYLETEYSNSGNFTADETVAAFSQYMEHVAKGTSPQNKEEALKFASDGGHTYLIFPTILHWEDRATEWSSRQDQMSVKVEIIDSRNGQLLDSVVLRGTSRWFTFGGDHPQDLLKVPMEGYVATLFKHSGENLRSE